MARLLANLVQAALAADITDTDTTVTFTAPLREYGTTNLATIAAPDTLTLRVGFELLHVTAYTAGSTSATVVRGAEGSTATAHNAGDMARHVSTDADFVGGALAAHEADTTNVHGIADTATLETTTGAQAKVDAHVNDVTDAHDASAVSVTPTGLIVATDVQAALAELDAEKIAAATLTTNDDLLTRTAGVPARLTRADLAADPAFSGTYAPGGVVRKAADETVNNSSTIQSDDELSFAIAANETVVGEMVLFVEGDATADMLVAVGFPAGASAIYGCLGALTGAPQVQTNDSKTGNLQTILVGADAFQRAQIIYFSIANGATAGSVSLWWTQNTATVADTKVLAGSYITYRKQV